MNKIRFISSYTPGTIYENIIQDLKASIEAFNLPYHIFAVPDLGEWKINSRQRPLYIKKAMEMFPGENIVWIDADAKVLKYPELFYVIPENTDIAVNYMRWSDHYGRPSDGEKVEILDGTSYYRNSPEMIPFMDEWIDRAVTAGRNHRLTLRDMITERIEDSLHLFILPREYCYVTTKPDGSKPAFPLESPVIAHYQASRIAREDLYGKRG